MRAAFLKGTQLSLVEMEKPKSQPGAAIVKVRMAGICNTDLELVRGYMNFQGVPGHEFVGVVSECEEQHWVGKRVCGEINVGCRNCQYCRLDLSRHCPNRTVMGILNQNGAFAEYVLVPAKNLREVPVQVSDHQAVFVEPLAAAFEIMEQVKLAPNSQIAVIGDGKLGLLIAQVLQLSCADITLVGKHERKLDFARALGLSTCLKNAAIAKTYNIVVEASGSPSGFESALNIVRPRGTVVLKSTYADNLNLNAAPIVIDEITIVGSRCGQFMPALRALAAKRVQIDGLIEQIYPFAQFSEAFERAKQPDSLKVLVDFDA